LFLREFGKCQCAQTFGRSADYKSAIRQITNLRYDARETAFFFPPARFDKILPEIIWQWIKMFN